MHFYRIKLVKGLFKLQQPGLNAETGEGVAYSGASCHATLTDVSYKAKNITWECAKKVLNKKKT